MLMGCFGRMRRMICGLVIIGPSGFAKQVLHKRESRMDMLSYNLPNNAVGERLPKWPCNLHRICLDTWLSNAVLIQLCLLWASPHGSFELFPLNFTKVNNWWLVKRDQRRTIMRYSVPSGINFWGRGATIYRRIVEGSVEPHYHGLDGNICWSCNGSITILFSAACPLTV